MSRKVSLILIGSILGAVEVFLGWIVLPENFLGGVLIFIGLGYCIGGGFFLALSPRSSVDSADRSLLYMAPDALLILLAMPLEYRFLPEALPRVRAMQWVGLGVILLGMVLRLWARQALKQAYQGNLQVQPGQKVVSSGPYRWVRHPGYFAFVLQALGLCIGFSSLGGLLGLLLFILALCNRIRIEEAMMAQSFGDEYIRYAKRTSRLVPGIW